MNPRVFAPQVPSRYDSATRLWIPTMNMAPARKYGELVVLLPANANRLHTSPLIAALREGMSTFRAEDALIAVGDPTLIAAATLIAARKTGGAVRMLKWDRMMGDYILVEVSA